jgi:hypothetical protein
MHASIMHAFIIVHASICVLPAGCAWTFDGEALDVPLVGDAPPILGPRIALSGADSLEFVRGADGADWVALPTCDTIGRNAVRVDRLEAPAAEELLSATRIVVAARAFFLIDAGPDPMGPATLTVRAAAEQPGHAFTLPSALGDLVVGAGGDVFAYRASTPPGGGYRLFRRDGSFARDVPPTPPSHVDTTRVFFDGAGDLFFVYDGCPAPGRASDPCNTVTAYSTTDGSDFVVGNFPGDLRVDDADHAILGCDDGGLRVVDLRAPPDTPPRVLDSGACMVIESASLWRGLAGRVAYWSGPPLAPMSRLLVVPFDGSAPPRLLFEEAMGLEALAVSATAAAYTHNAPTGFPMVGDASDGWIGDWRFMERGRFASFSADGTRIRWLEHSARDYPSGDLLSAPATGGDALRLAANVYEYDELGDGRVIAADNQAFAGPQNRVIAIDERHRIARRIAEGASSFYLLPGSPDALVVALVSAVDGYELARVDLPPP